MRENKENREVDAPDATKVKWVPNDIHALGTQVYAL